MKFRSPLQQFAPALGSSPLGPLGTQKAPIWIDDEPQVTREVTRKKASLTMGQVLKEAANRRARLVEKEESQRRKKKKKKRGRSRSRSRRRRRSRSTSSSSLNGLSSSTSDKMMPPLQKKATRKPGSLRCSLLVG